MAVSKRLRYEILRRDGHTCRYCGASAPDAPLRVDHVTAVALGGADTPDNLVTSCEPCNSGKSSMPTDAALVSDVADSALHWAAAIKQAAEELRAQEEPKRAYRNAFQQAWNEWTWEHNGKREPHDLEDGWKSSIDNFREAGLPIEVWPDIIEKAMTNKTVKAENLLRYSCGIAWRIVRELQERAKAIVGATAAPAKAADSALSLIGQAAVDRWAHAWTSDLEEAPSDEERSKFVQSLVQLEGISEWVDPRQLIAAAVFGGSGGFSTIQDAMADTADQERAGVVIEWCDAWTDLDGASTHTEPPDTFLFRVVQNQVDDLADAGISLDRIRRAALCAGYHHSSELHHGLRANEVEHTGVDAFSQRAVDLWSRSFRACANRWPGPEERGAFLSQYRRVADDADFYLNDALAAAVAAGAYQDVDLTTCLTRHLSVFEAAARPLAPFAV